jgi:hypothetical protein
MKHVKIPRLDILDGVEAAIVPKLTAGDDWAVVKKVEVQNMLWRDTWVQIRPVVRVTPWASHIT